MRLTAENHAGFFSPAFRIADRLVTASLAALLLIAAVLKAIRGESPIAVPFALELVVFVEVAGAFLLLLHPTNPCTRLAAAILFATLAAFASGAALDGQSSCGCLGKTQISPTWVAGIDLFAVAWLAGSTAFVHWPFARDIERQQLAT